MSVESSPADSPKQQLPASGAEEKANITRSKEIWFDDGNVVLQVDSTQFRIHRSVLARHSPVFQGMFTVPQPEESSSEWVDGCPLSRVFGDSPEDWEHVLLHMYCITQLEPRWPSVPQVAAILRLGKKYELDGLRSKAWELLKAQYPESLEAFSFITRDYPPRFENWLNENMDLILHLAEEMGYWSILPVTYYLALTCSHIDIFSTHYNLSANHLRSLASGHIEIGNAIIGESLKWLQTKSSTSIPLSACTRPGKCSTARNDICSNMLGMDQVDSICLALAPWDDAVDDRELCDKCRKSAKGEFEESRERIWDELGRYFLGEDWDELVDMDLSSLPKANWTR